jgi:heterodisulfide reductase subunit B2
MEPVNQKIALYPGCSLEGSSVGFAESLDKVFGALEIELDELKEWNCCGATSAHAIDHELYLALNLRNLALAEEQGYGEILAPCAACYHRLAGAAFELEQSPELLKKISAKAGIKYGGGVRVRNVLDLIANGIGTQRITARVKSPLAGLRVACYYGCLNTRIPRMASFDDRDYPMSMDRIVQALGAAPIDWSYKTECCGASLFLTSEETQTRLAAKILKDAAARGADAIAVACPMCQNNLDTKQDAMRAAFGIEKALPVAFVTQLMGLAFGLSASELGLKRNFVPLEAGAWGAVK